MKKLICLLFVILNIHQLLFADEKIFIIEKILTIKKPENVLLRKDIPEFEDNEKSIEFENKRYILYFKSYPYRDYKKMEENNLDDWSKLSESLNFINYKDKKIGQHYFSCGQDGNFAPLAYSYSGKIFIDKKFVVKMVLSYIEYSQDIVKDSRYFEGKTYGVGFEYFWKTESSKKDLYEDIISGENSEEIKPLILLNKYWEQIIKSIEIVDRKGILNDSKVRIRKEPNLDGEQLGYLNKGQKVSILEETDQKMKIGEMDAVWYKVETEDGVVGWAYGWFIDIVNE